MNHLYFRLLGRAFVVAAMGAALLPGTIFAAEMRKVLPGHMPAGITNFSPLGTLSATNRLSLAIGLPLRDEAGLTAFLAQVYDPASTNYHHYLTPQQFAERFGPTASDYAAVFHFAATNGLTITATHTNRLVLDVNGSITDIQRAFHITLHNYRHPTEGRIFFAPDSEPSVDADLPVADISGLSDYVRPHPRSLRRDLARGVGAAPRTGSGAEGTFIGNDFRAAYVPNTTLTGTGQKLGLFEFDGYYQEDLYSYESAANLPDISIQTVLVDGFDGNPTTGTNSGDIEVSLDAEVAMSMAPGLDGIVMFEGGPNGIPNDVLTAITEHTEVNQISCSWGWQGGPAATTDALFQQMAAQGQTFVSASGDSDAFTVGASSVNGMDNPSLYNAPSSCPYILQVGATTLATTGPGGAYVSEAVWNWGTYGSGGEGSGGGVSSYYTIPSWQTNVSMASNGGSTKYRNTPDVAMVGDNIDVIYGQGNITSIGGTSCSAPAWAGLVALINQQAVGAGQSPVGFLNPAIYALGKSGRYSVLFHDVTTGSNIWSGSPNNYHAVTGYDLCTGWGTPTGQSLINALAGSVDLLSETPMIGFTANGAVGGPFSYVPAQLALTNLSSANLNWSLINTSAWLNASVTAGLLGASGTASVTVSLTTAANALAAGTYTVSLVFSNENSGYAQAIPFTLQVGQSVLQNGDFETGDFTYWSLSGQSTYTGVVPYSEFPQAVYSGNYGAVFGDSTLTTLSQNIPTVPGQNYSLSLWLNDPTGGSGEKFVVNWNTNNTSHTLYSISNPAAFGWTNLQFSVTAGSTNTTLQIEGENSTYYFGLDDVTVTPITTLPTVAITNLPAGLTVSNAVFTVEGTARDVGIVAGVYVALNGGAWTQATGTNPWSLALDLTPGTNLVQAYSVDMSGNDSMTSSATLFYVQSGALTVATNGLGVITPNENGASLPLGKAYTLTAKPAAGFAFVNWTNSLAGETTSPVLSFIMEPGLVLTATFADTNRPTLKITNLPTGLVVSNSQFTVAGTAADNWAVSTIWVELGSNAWMEAAGASNWNASVALTPGTNTLRAYAVDTSGNISLTNSAMVFYAQTAPLTILTNGLGTLTPNDAGQLLRLGQSYSLTAKPATGFKFLNWTNGLTGAVSNSLTLNFTMNSNLVLTATFVDTNRPTVSITNLVTGQRVTNAAFTVRGKAADNWQVAAIYYQWNNGGWTAAQGTTNWSAPVSFLPGTNSVQVYAVDTSGNLSLTNTVNCDYVVTNQLLLQSIGLGKFSPDYSNAWLEVGRNYTITATPASGFVFTNWGVTNLMDNIAWSTNKTALQFAMTSNLVLTATFAETARPTLSITNLTAKQRLNGNAFAVKGKAADGWQVTAVWCQINSNGWALATSANGYTNWTANMTLASGTNVVTAYAVNLGGIHSLTNSVSVVATNVVASDVAQRAGVPSKPALVFSQARLSAPAMTFSLQVVGTGNGVIQVSTNLVDWTTLTNFTGTNATIQFTDAMATNGASRFYRAVVPW